MDENRVNFVFATGEHQLFEESVQNLLNILAPHDVVLSDVELKTLPRVADGTLPFVEKSSSYTRSHPQFKPDYVNADELAADVEGYKLSNQLLTRVAEVYRMLEHISILSGSEAYSASLSYYRNVKSQAKDNRPGAKVVYEDLQQRFQGQGRKPAAK